MFMNRLGVVLSVLLFTIGIVNAGCSGYVAGPTNSPPAAPSITTQPANQTVTAGQMATFPVAAAGTAPLCYQWEKKRGGLSRAASAGDTTPPPPPPGNNTQLTPTASHTTRSTTSKHAP